MKKKSKFKVGDKVRIRADLTEKEKHRDDGPGWDDGHMDLFMGHIFKIIKLSHYNERIPYSYYKYYLRDIGDEEFDKDIHGYSWHEDWLTNPCKLNRGG